MIVNNPPRWDPNENQLFLDLHAKYCKNGNQWKALAKELSELTQKDYSGDQCMGRYRVLDPALLHSPWSPEDDQRLVDLVAKAKKQETNGKPCFAKIAKHFPGRDPRQCRNRFQDYVNPDLDASPLRDEELEQIFQGLIFEKKTYSQIRDELPTKRSSNIIKNMWTKKSTQSIVNSIVNDRDCLYGKRHLASDIVAQIRAMTPCSSTASTPSIPGTPKRRRGDSDITSSADTSPCPSTPFTPDRTSSSSVLGDSSPEGSSMDDRSETPFFYLLKSDEGPPSFDPAPLPPDVTKQPFIQRSIPLDTITELKGDDNDADSIDSLEEAISRFSLDSDFESDFTPVPQAPQTGSFNPTNNNTQ